MKKIIFFDIDDTLFKTSLFIKSGQKKYQTYKEALKVIENIKKTSEVAILSKGEYDFQVKKLKETNLLNLFKKENIYIVAEKKEELKKIFIKYKDHSIYVIEDRSDNLAEIKKMFPQINSILIKRGRYKNLPELNPDHIVKNLNKTLTII